MFKKLATSLGLSTPDPPPASVIAQMGKRTFKVEFEPESDFDDPVRGATVGFLRNKIAEATNHHTKNVTLVYGGRKLTDDTSYLSDYSIKTDAKILVVASSVVKNKKPKIKPAPPPPAPKSGRERIQEVVEHTHNDLEKLVCKFEQQSTDDLTLEKAADEHHRLSEVVLQKMFTLDDVDVTDDEELRQFRKDTINNMHVLHKRVDAAYEQKKDVLYKKKIDEQGGENGDNAATVTVAAKEKEDTPESRPDAAKE